MEAPLILDQIYQQPEPSTASTSPVAVARPWTGAISMHKRNHPGAEHYITDIYDVCPRMITMENVVPPFNGAP